MNKDENKQNLREIMKEKQNNQEGRKSKDIKEKIEIIQEGNNAGPKRQIM